MLLRKQLVHVAMTAMLLSPGFSAFAQDSAAPPPPPTETGTMRKERMQDRQERREERRAKLDEARKARVRRYWQEMKAKIERRIRRLTSIADRIDARIEKFEAKGADVSEARAKVEAAREEIAAGEAALNDAILSVEEMLESDNPKGVFENVRGEVRSVIKHLKDAHALLVDAVKILKGMSSAVPADTDVPTE